MTVMTRTTVASLTADDTVILTDGGEPFVVVGAGESLGEVRQIDVARPGAAVPPVRLTLSVDHEVLLR